MTASLRLAMAETNTHIFVVILKSNNYRVDLETLFLGISVTIAAGKQQFLQDQPG